MNNQIFFGLKDLARLHGVSRSTIYRWRKLGLLPEPVEGPFGSPRWRVEDVETYLESL